MIRDHFRVLRVDLDSGKGQVTHLDGRTAVAGGSGLAALLFDTYGQPAMPWDAPEQPLIFAIGPLTGYFPLMSKTVCAFKSPYHDQYAESHAGGRSALALRFADLDALVITGRAARPACLVVGAHHLSIEDVHYLWGKPTDRTGKMLRRMFPGSGHRSILRIGPAGETGSAMACINVDTYRHFGRLGGGAVMGVKRIKGIVIEGDAAFDLPESKAYADLFRSVYSDLTRTEMMDKYHNLGTAVNMVVLNGIRALPVRNLQQTTDPAMAAISGEALAGKTLLRNLACAGCPVGCIHLGYFREKFMDPNQYHFRQVSYDHEPIFAMGAMLAVTDPQRVLALLETAEKTGLDVMSAGVALAWATEAVEKGLVSEAETIVPLAFGDHEHYRQAIEHLGRGANDFYRLLGKGTLKAAGYYGGADFACVLGQEMAGYATGEVFFTSQALGFRHSHLDSGGYAYDQKDGDRAVDTAVQFLVADERARGFLTSMVACLFARSVYTPQRLAECLDAVGYTALAQSTDETALRIQKKRWQMRFATGYDPTTVALPQRFREVATWRGPIDASYLNALQTAYAVAIGQLARPEAESTSKGKE
jgi:aldehyde:ferredoxin oxidoreductase